MEIRNGIIFFDTKAEFEAYVSDTNNVSITNYPVYIGDTKEIITHNVTYKDASEIDASQITSGTISVDRLPAGSLERCVVVANESARFALTTNDVQDGDTVKQSDTGVMYMVVDVNNLNSDAGYLTYTAVTNWESIANKPEFDYVKYSEQVLTAEQMLQARKNINAIGDVINITFDEFMNLLSTTGLIPFQEYRITDYCQVKYGDSAQHYDLIVKGTSNGWVSSQARAFWHEDPNNSYLWLIGMFSGPSFGVLGKYFGTAEEDGVVYHVWGANGETFFRSETRYPEYGKYVEGNGAMPIGEVSCPYFLLEDVTKWEIDINVDWRTLDSAALDVIRMRDTYGNEAPYDFKNVKISLRDITDAYTFSMLIDNVYYDASSTGINVRGFIRPVIAYHNTITSSLYKDYNKNILITNDSTYDIKNNFLSDCYDNILVNSHDNYLYNCRNNQMDTVLNCSFDYCNSNVIDAASQSKFEGAHSQNYSQMFNRFVSKNENDELVNINIPSAIEAKQEKLISGETIKTINNESLLGEGNIEIGSYENITYEELYALKAQGKLVPDRLYCITNFHLLPNERSGLKETTNQYDLIVTATSNDTISNRAFAKYHENDTYFSNCNLAKWQIWYDFEANSVNAQKLVINISNSLIPAASEINIPVYVLENGDKVLCNNVYMASGYHYSCPSLINQNTYYCVNQNELNIGDIVYSTDGDPIAIVDITKGYAFGPWYSSGSYKRYYYSINSIPQVGDSIAIVYFYGDEFMNVSGFNTIDDVQYSTGWIYRMIDEYENDVPYDFKTLTTYNRQKNAYYYTFGFESDVDMSLTGSCYRNIIVGTGWDSYINRGNVFGAGSFDNFVVGQRNVITGSWNRIESGDDNIINGDQNSLCTNAYNIKVTGYDNTFNPGCTEITISGNYNNIGNGCYGITFSGDHNVFNPGCTNITAGEQFTCNVIKGFTDMIEAGNNCYENVLGGVGLTLPDNFRNNTLEQVSELTVTSVNESEYVQNVTFKKEVTGSIEIPVTNQDYSLTVTKNSNGELQIYNEADLVDPDIEHLVEVTYEELFEMQCLSKLTPGVKYRIVNYKPTILYPGASSNDIGFDIIVKALSKNELDEDAEFIPNGITSIYAENGDHFASAGCKEKCLEIEIDGGFALFTYVGCEYAPDLVKHFGGEEYVFWWSCLNANAYDIVYSFIRHPKEGDTIYVGAGSAGFLPSYSVLTSEKLYSVICYDINDFVATDTVFIWKGLEKSTVSFCGLNTDDLYLFEKGTIKYVNPLDNTDIMNCFTVYHDVMLFDNNESVAHRSLFQWDRYFGKSVSYDPTYQETCIIGSETNPFDAGDLSVGSKHIAWIVGCGPYPIGECVIRGYGFNFRNRGFINYMKSTRGDEANIDFYNTVFEQGPVLDLTFDKPNKIINSVYNDPNLQYQNIYEYPEQCFIPVGGGNIIEESSNVNISGNYNIIQYSEYVFFDNAWNNQILHSDNISFNRPNNTNNIINQCSKLTFNNWIYRSMFVHSIDRSFNEMVNNQYVIGKYDLDDFVSDPILNSTF